MLLATKTLSSSNCATVGDSNWHEVRSSTSSSAPVEAFITTIAPKSPPEVVTKSWPLLTTADPGSSR
jgi:hypothetical protein